MSTGRWFAASRPDLGAFTFSSSLLPDASAASLDPDPLPPRPLAGFWAAAAAGTPAAAGGAASGSGAGQAALGQAQFAVAHGDKVLLSGGYFDGSLRWVVTDWWLFQILCAQLSAPACSTGGSCAASAVCKEGRAAGQLDWVCAEPGYCHFNTPLCRIVLARALLLCGCCRAHGTDDGRLLQALAYHKDTVTCVAASSGERAGAGAAAFIQVASETYDSYVLGTGKCLAVLSWSALKCPPVGAPCGPVGTPCGPWPPHLADGRVVVSGSADTTLMVWDANPGFGRGECRAIIGDGSCTELAMRWKQFQLGAAIWLQSGQPLAVLRRLWVAPVMCTPTCVHQAV